MPEEEMLDEAMDLIVMNRAANWAGKRRLG